MKHDEHNPDDIGVQPPTSDVSWNPVTDIYTYFNAETDRHVLVEGPLVRHFQKVRRPQHLDSFGVARYLGGIFITEQKRRGESFDYVLLTMPENGVLITLIGNA